MIAWLDAASGLSGDKLLSALLDLGERRDAFGLDDVRIAVESLGVEGVIVGSHDVVRGGLRGRHLTVEVTVDQPHRHWRDIRSALACATLPGTAADRALATFGLLAEAEARVHGCAIDDVHFHEVGAADSLLDIVGVCLGLELLGIEELVVSPIAVGDGVVTTAHGTLPVPAPATLELLRDAPVFGGAAGELTTPTGAALAVANATAFGPLPPMRVTAVGYGAGSRDVPGLPNVLRIVSGESLPVGAASLTSEDVALLESTIDHLSPEALAVVTDQLRAEGVLDAWMSPVVMKKGRPAVILAVLVSQERSQSTAERIVELTGSLGVRVRRLERLIASREIVSVATPFGDVRFKVGAGRARPEADDVARIAREHGRGFGDIEGELMVYAPAD